MMIHTSMETLVYFWIVIPLHIKQAAIKLQLFICATQTRVGIPFGKDTFNQTR